MLLDPLIQRLPTALRTRLQSRATLLKAAENTGWLLLNQALRLVVALVVGVWVARYLGPADFGLFNYAIAFAGFFGAIVPLGLHQITVRDLAVDHDRRGVIMGTAFGLQAITAVLMLALSLGIALFTQAGDPVQLQLVLIASLVTLARPVTAVQFWYQSQHQSHRTLLANTVSLSCMVLMRIALLVTGATVAAFVWVLVIEQTIYAAAMLILYQRSGESVRAWRFDWPRARSNFWEGVPYLLSAIAINAYTRGNQIMVTTLVGATANGYFAAATRINELWLLAPNAIINSALPIIARAKQQSEYAYERKLVLLFRLTAGLGLSAALTVSLLAPWVIHLVYGPAYDRATHILTLQMWMAVPYAIQLGNGPWLVNQGLARIVLEKTVAQAALVLILNFWLIPRYEGEGAAISMLIAAALVNILWDFFDSRLRPLQRIKLHAWLPWWFRL
jgi:PST family polysaccharide transporter